MVKDLTLWARGQKHRARRSSALIITLVVLVLVTVLVVSLLGTVSLERVTTHSSFENERARQFANMAVDVVAGTLRDNIPDNSQWAAGPGHLQVWSTSSNTWTEIPLYSGNSTASTSTGVVNLNKPVLGGSSTTTYPIIPVNSIDYSSAVTMNVGWTEVLQDGTLITNGASAEPTNDTSNNPIVGRFAYWVDTEDSKIDLNVAGRAQTTYNFYPATPASTHSQNLTGSPTRAGLVDLDGSGGAITFAIEKATYHFNSGSYYAGDLMTNYGPTYAYMRANSWTATNVATPPAGTMYAGLQRFNSIWDITQMTNDMESGASFSSSTALANAQVIPNVFYLTVKARAPEVNPWGYNKWWTESYLPNLYTRTTGVTNLSTTGNLANGRGYPLYPYNVVATNLPPGFNSGNNYYPVSGTVLNPTNGPPLNTKMVSSRFYVYPPPSSQTAKANPTNLYPDGGYLDMQSMAPYLAYGASGWTNSAPFPTFITPMMQMLNRTDWPGMPSTSFVQKYGTNECIDLCWNLLTFYNATICQSGPDPYGFNGDLDFDQNEHYGKSLYLYPTYSATLTNNNPMSSAAAWAAQGSLAAGGNIPSRYMINSGAIEQPMINEIAVTFTGTTSGYTPIMTTTAQADQNATQQVYNTAGMIQDGGPMWSTQYGGYTKDGTRPGFAPPIGSGDPIGWTNTTLYTNAEPVANFPYGGTNGGLQSGMFPNTPIKALVHKTNYMNVAISPAIQLWYPPNYPDSQNSAGNMLSGAYFTDILVSANGHYTPVNPTTGALGTTLNVTYGGPSVSATNVSNGEAECYYWGFPDDHPQVIPTTSPTKKAGSANGLQLTASTGMNSTSPKFPISTTNYWTMAYGTASNTSVIPSPIYVGPFDQNSPVTVSIQFRVALCGSNQDSSSVADQFVPVGANYGTTGTNSYPPGNYKGYYLNGGSYANANTVPAVTASAPSGLAHPSWADQQAFDNVLTNTAWCATLTFTTNIAALTTSSNVIRKYVSDPRVSRYVSDWSQDNSATTGTLGIIPANIFPLPGAGAAGYVGTNAVDPLTGGYGDWSKLAYPPMGPAFAHEMNAVTADPRFADFCNNITTFPGIGWISVLPLNIESSQGSPTSGPNASTTNGYSWGYGSGTNTYTPVPWRTISLLPQVKNVNQLPDWLLLDIFATAYDQTYLSQTEGKINVNASVWPFSKLVRSVPLESVIYPGPGDSFYGYQSPGIAFDEVPNLSQSGTLAMVANLATNRPTTQADYATNSNFNLPTNMFVYTGQVAQVSDLNYSTTNGVSNGATNQFQYESTLRNLAGVFTTKCSDYTVHVYAQSVKQVGFTGNISNDLLVTGEQRLHALISRETYTGPSNFPEVSDPTFTFDNNWKAYRPQFKYVISDVEYINN